MNEYDYLRAFVMERFDSEVTTEVDPLHDQHKLLLLQKNYLGAARLETLRDRILQELYIKRARAEEIINWLSLDNQLRRECCISNALQDENYNILVAEHRDRVTRFGLNYIKLLLESTSKKLEIVNDAENGKDELMQDLVLVITSFVQRIYELRRAKRKTEKLIADLRANGEDDETR